MAEPASSGVQPAGLGELSEWRWLLVLEGLSGLVGLLAWAVPAGSVAQSAWVAISWGGITYRVQFVALLRVPGRKWCRS